MSERTRKALVAAELLFLLLPATLAMALVVGLSYPAYPPPVLSPLNLLFDAALLVTVLALLAAWRGGLLYLGHGRLGLRRVGAPGLTLLAGGTALGFAGAAVAVWHVLGGPPVDAVGFALLAPGAVLVVLGWHLWAERRRA